MSVVEVRELDRADMPRWNDFVKACPEATFFHRAEWRKVIEQAFGHQTHFLYALRGGNIEGVLPLAHVSSFLFGSALVSLPFCVYGGIAATTSEARQALAQAAADKARQLAVDYLELRHERQQLTGWPAKNELYVTFRKEIDPEPERNLLAIPRKQRAMVRKGIDAGLQAEWDEDTGHLYDLYSQSVHALGTPVFSRRYLEILRREFGQDCRVLTIVDRCGVPVSSVMSFYFRDQVLPYYGGGSAAAREVKANDFMYWELLRRSCEQGIKVFDYGRSKVGTGSYSFKKNWGFEPTPLHYEYQLVRAKTVPDVNPLNPKYRFFIQAWKRLPLAVTRMLGPHIVRNLG